MRVQSDTSLPRLRAGKATFDEYAPDYDAALDCGLAVTGEEKEYFARGRVAQTRSILERLGLRPRLVMDYGCGTGSTAPLLLEAWQGCSLIGVDTSPESIRVARSTYASPNVHFELVTQYSPASDRDVVYCNGVFHHIPPQERPEALAFVAAALAPGGIFALCENNPWNPGTRYVMSRIPFDRDAIPLSPPQARALLRAGGFEILGTHSLFVFPRPLSWLRPLERSLTRLPIGGQYIVFGRKPAAPRDVRPNARRS